MIWTGFVIGLLGSWHCIGMCGPLALMVPGSKGRNRFAAIGLYFYGKTLAYLSIASVFGMIPVFVNSFLIQAIITISVGLVMLLIAFLPSISTRFEQKGFVFFNRYFKLKNRLALALKKDKILYGFYIGFLNGFMPCGLVYIAALGAMSQPGLPESLLFMLLFAAGTIPLMSVFLVAAGYFKPYFARHISRLRTVGFVLVGVFMIPQGIVHWNQVIEQPKAGENFIACPVTH